MGTHSYSISFLRALTFNGLIALMAFSYLSQANAEERLQRRSGPTRSAPARTTGVARSNLQHEEFPKYPQSHPTGVNHPFVQRQDTLGNHITDNHLQRQSFATNRIETHMVHDVHVNEVVTRGRASYANYYRPEFDRRVPVINIGIRHYNSMLIAHPIFFNHWHNHFFYGGYYYGFHPVPEIDLYFYNPMVYWFYQPAIDEGYYRNWYGPHYDAYPILHQPFAYHGLYYPTENLRLLLFGVSAMTVDKQVNFRQSMNLFTQELAQNMANSLHTHVRLANGDVVITHYEMLGTDEGVVVEGFVNMGEMDYNFKGVLDLNVPARTEVLAPVSMDQDPTVQQLTTIDHINAHVAELRGEPVPPPQSPIQAMPAPIQPGAIEVDPKN
jgi:hypothetical protein